MNSWFQVAVVYICGFVIPTILLLVWLLIQRQ